MWLWTWYGWTFVKITLDWEMMGRYYLPGGRGIGGIPPGYVGC